MTLLAQANDNSYLLSEKGRLVQEFTKHWSGSELLDMTGIAVVAVGLVCVAGAWVAWRRYRTRDQRSHPGAVFRHIARRVGLGWFDRRLLTSIAREQQLPSPITLLLSSATFSHHADAHAQDMPTARAARFHARCARLKRSLFSNSEHV